MTTYKMAYKKLLERHFYAHEIDEDKLHFIIETNYRGWADLSAKSMDKIAFSVCNTWGGK